MTGPAEIALEETPPRARDALQWGGAGLVMLLMHAAVLTAIRPAEPFATPPDAIEQAMDVELAPMLVTTPDSAGAEEIAAIAPPESIAPVEDPLGAPSAEEPAAVQQVLSERAVETAPADAARVEPDTIEPSRIEPLVAETARIAPTHPVSPTLRPDLIEPVPVEPDPGPPATEPSSQVLPTLESVTPDTLVQAMPDPVDADAPDAEVVLPVPAIVPTLKPLVQEPPARVTAPAKPRETPRRRDARAMPAARGQAPARSEKPARPVRSAQASGAVSRMAQTRSAVARAPQTASAASRASKAAKAPAVSPDRWNRSVRQAISRRVGRLRSGRGTVNISFVVSRSGSVVSARVSRSSGNARLDAAALNAVRATRVPAPPADLGGSSHAFSVPLTFR